VKHLPDIAFPMLFVQGSRDPFGTPDELRPILKELKAPTDLYVVEGGDHSFKVLKRAGITPRLANFHTPPGQVLLRPHGLVLLHR
jgi:predicted alpha/beta-hydrolase family hydrolase